MKPVSYYKFEILSDELKERNKIKIGASVPRYDCTKYSGDYEGMKAFTNAKGMFILYLMESDKLIRANEKRLSEFVLKGVKSLNFTSMYFEDVTSPNYCYGYPNGKPMLNNGTSNPVFAFRQDLYLILVKEDFTEFEILVFKNSKGFASDYLQNFINGEFDEELQEMRNEAKEFFRY